MPLADVLAAALRNEAEALAALGAGLSQQHRLDPPMGCVTDVQARHLIGRMLQRLPSPPSASTSPASSAGYLSGGMDTVEMDETFGPLTRDSCSRDLCCSSSSTRRESASDRTVQSIRHSGARH